MAITEETRNLRNTRLSDVDLPDSAWLTYAVCAGESDSCGWGGWIIDSLVSDRMGKGLSIHERHLCPKCGKDLFKTGASVKFIPSDDQSENLAAGVVYETIPMEMSRDSHQ
ncbi:MAG TPA: hypothetical protein DCZ75_08835 [Geobacter sp.]|nr:hypothetical protein [Geobacter sp.]